MTDKFVGPDGFTSRLLKAREISESADSRKRLKEELLGNISEQGLQTLVQIAYYTSLLPNEGRFPRLTLFVPSEKQQASNIIFPLEQTLNEDSLRRLAPTVTKDNALLVMEKTVSLEIRGIIAFRGVVANSIHSMYSSLPFGRASGFVIDILGPGDVRAGEIQAFRYRGGMIYCEESFAETSWFRIWRQEVARLANDADQNARLQMLFTSVLYQILRKTAERNHGGCFVILPEPSDASLTSCYKTTLRGSYCAFDFVLWQVSGLLVKPGPPEAAEPNDAIQFLINREVVSAATDAIAGLALTDGCVLLDRCLGVYSFGSMISTPNEDTKLISFYQGDSSIKIDGEKIKSFGGRRQSALQICKDCPGAMAFVISQDGDLRVFVSLREGEETVVRLYERASYW